MNLGAFSLSLAVKDLARSRDFYEALGFKPVAGSMDAHYLILQNDDTPGQKHLLGLFEGMFDENILTFNPGWDADGSAVDPFTDVRQIQDQLKDKGIEVGSGIEPGTTGPASFTVTDPDGNVILFDQHR